MVASLNLLSLNFFFLSIQLRSCCLCTSVLLLTLCYEEKITSKQIQENKMVTDKHVEPYFSLIYPHSFPEER